MKLLTLAALALVLPLAGHAESIMCWEVAEITKIAATLRDNGMPKSQVDAEAKRKFKGERRKLALSVNDLVYSTRATPEQLYTVVFYKCNNEK